MHNIQKTSSTAIPQELKNTCLTNIFGAPAMMPSPATAIIDVKLHHRLVLSQRRCMWRWKTMSQMWYQQYKGKRHLHEMVWEKPPWIGYFWPGSIGQEGGHWGRKAGQVFPTAKPWDLSGKLETLNQEGKNTEQMWLKQRVGRDAIQMPCFCAVLKQ